MILSSMENRRARNERKALVVQASCRLLSRRGQHGGLSRWIKGVRERHSKAVETSLDGPPSLAVAAAGPACMWTRASSLVQAGGSLLKTLSSFSSAPTKCMSVTPDGGLLLTVEGRVSRLWDVRSGYCVRVLEGFKDSLMSGALSPDGAYAVTIADHKGEDIGRVWDCSTGSCVHVLEGHGDLIQDLQISGDSRLAVTASYDHTACVWNLMDGKRLHVLMGHTDYVESAAFSKDSARVVTGSWDKTARVWDTTTGACLHTLEGHTDRVWRIVLGSFTLV
jgi:WD40 repeat protein